MKLTCFLAVASLAVVACSDSQLDDESSDAAIDPVGGDGDAGNTPERDAGNGDPGEPDAGAQQSDAGTRCPVALRCVDNRLEKCVDGVFVLDAECEFACHDLACTGTCEPGALRCGGDALRAPEVCAVNGEWTANTAENGGAACPFVCDEGACTGECTPSEDRCDDNTRQVCGADGHWADDRVCTDLCRDGSCSSLASCSAAAPCAGDESCCVSHVVPAGTFSRSYDILWWTDPSYVATISAFRLDRFEVTVGRFRQWLSVYAEGGARPSGGAGKNPANAEDPGWSATWDSLLVPTAAELKEKLVACTDTSWTEIPMGNEDKPINCVTWHEAFAFCIWDQGRLPTEAEWNYAAAGGAEQRVLPWSASGTKDTIDDTYAVFYPAALSAVGSKPNGDGKWQQADLGGNVEEWLLDWYQDPYAIIPCNDCSDFQESGLRVLRGGAYAWTEDSLYASARSSFLPQSRSSKIGFRCARAE
jgi:sulfatase modifying factor 1